MTRLEAYFEPADNVVVELTDSERSEDHDFGKEVRLTAVSVSHGNDDYVTVSLYRFGDTKPFWSAKFYKGLNGQVFIQPIPKNPLRKITVKVAPGGTLTEIKDSVIVNISYI